MIKNIKKRYKTLLRYFASRRFNNFPTYNLGTAASNLIPKTNNIFFDIKDLKDKFLDERCFIIGNGPSLNKTDIKLLKTEYSIGLNRIYLNYNKMGFEPTFYCAVNPNVIEQFAHEIDKINSIKFIRKNFKKLLKNKWNVFFVESLSGHGFNTNFESLAWHEGWTVTYSALQLAFFLGFKTVILIGVDHFFIETGNPNELAISNSSDPNHFHPDYFSKGVKWNYPDLEKSEQSYRTANEVYRHHGREILDATIDGKLTVFPKVDYSSLFNKKLRSKV